MRERPDGMLEAETFEEHMAPGVSWVEDPLFAAAFAQVVEEEPMRFEIFQRRNAFGLQRWYFRIKARNHEIIAQSQAYKSYQNAWDTCDSIRLGLSPLSLIIKRDRV